MNNPGHSENSEDLGNLNVQLAAQIRDLYTSLRHVGFGRFQSLAIVLTVIQANAN